MTNSSATHLMCLAPSGHLSQRQLSIVFESPVIQGMGPSERASAIAQLAVLLLQAARVHHAGADDAEH